MVKERYTVPDLLRGIAIVCMVVYHGLWDLVYLFDVSIPWFGSEGARIWQLSIRWAFLLISGFCWHLGSKKGRRGLLVLGCSVVITLVTAVFSPQSLILFGVLSLIGSAMLLFVPLDRYLKKMSPMLGAFLALALFLLTVDVEIGKFACWRLPDWLYQNLLTAYVGFPTAAFYSSDYVPLIPWLFVYAMGYFLYLILRRHGGLRYLSAVRCRPLEWLGRHSLIIYMLHQPLVYAALYILFL